MDRLDQESEHLIRAVEDAFDSLASEVRVSVRRCGSEFQFRGIMASLFGRSIRSFKAFAVLVRTGYTLEAELLTRNAFELLVEMLLLAQDPKSNAQQFVEYRDAARHKLVAYSDLLNKERGFPPINISGEDRERLAERHSAYVSEHGVETKDGVKKLPKHWSGLETVELRADKAGVLPVYHKGYRRQSRIGHVHPETHNAFWEQQSAETVDFRAYPDFQDVNWCVSTGCLIASWALEAACEHLELPCADVVLRVHQLTKRYSDAHLARADDEDRPFV